MLESIDFPEPVIDVAIEPKTKADQDKLAQALQQLAEEDPTFRVRTDEETGQTIIAGMGELHLEIIVDRLLREFKVDANVGKPAGGLPRDDPPQRSRREGRFVRQTGGHGQYGHVLIELEPQRAGRRASSSRTRSSAARSRGSTSRPSRRASARRCEAGVLAGFPVVDVKVDAGRRLLPRRRLVRDGVQDRRLDGVQGRRAQGAARCCSSR